MRFQVRGEFRKGKRRFPFTKVVEAPNEKLAREKILSIIGSNHKVKRNRIDIYEVKEIEA